MDWRSRGACLDEDPELFFPIGSSDAAYVQVEAARQVCGRCAVREQCLAWALKINQVQGVWGGTSELERAAMRTRARRTQQRAHAF
ncbi:WhiB family transcriptional regulator [Kribbella sp. CA-294648]|uniref:WhiB family transcriptional regulator n=1 Tax=Kribbella sp. CA-294648 TaxID=3239948 RepID=UPI003D911234